MARTTRLVDCSRQSAKRQTKAQANTPCRQAWSCVCARLGIAGHHFGQIPDRLNVRASSVFAKAWEASPSENRSAFAPLALHAWLVAYYVEASVAVDAS